ncbi:ATP-binding cassette domain-containing protein [Streptomyces sp. NPDC017936]|uniref:ATP-binding cassette domain-containing protein n=1 Tax=Streptomyces sp. NPDC017936 TaxID=3365016 RepID=UPI0037AA0D52
MFGLFRGYTVREFLVYAAWLREMPHDEIPAAVEWAARAVGPGDRLGQRLGRLSGGEKQRVGIAQAVINSPQLLFLDEPTVGLDVGRRARFHALVREPGRTSCVLLSTQLMAEDVRGVCTDAIILYRRNVVFHGTLTALDDAGGYDAFVPPGQ